MEIKTVNNSPTKLQDYQMTQIYTANGIAGVVRNLDDVRRLLAIARKHTDNKN
jgi:hypothetical protein